MGIVLGYIVAVLGIVLGYGVRGLLEPITGPYAGYLYYLPPIIAASLLGGARPALLAVALGMVASMPPLSRDTLPPGAHAALTIVFAINGVAIALIGERVHRSRKRITDIANQLRASEAHVRSILATIPDAMVVIDERGAISSFSAAAEKLFGWSSSDVIGRNVSVLMSSPYREAHHGYLDRYLRTGERKIIGSSRVVVGARRNGETFPMELHIGEMHSECDRYFTGFVKDLTERQQTEFRLQELQAELVHVSRRSAMGEMASTLAHELNQPLSAITNYLNGARRLLQRRDHADAEEKLRTAITAASDQALRADEIIRRMRAFLASGQTEREVLLLTQLIEEAGALALLGAKERGVRIHFDLAEKADVVFADRVQVQQVLVNLIRNALEAMDGKRRELAIRARSDGTKATISVSDTGSGISPDIADRLFQPFVTTKDEGLGVGLSVCRTIVEAHGGRIWVEDNPGGGTVFSFTLPTSTKEAFG